MSLLGYLRSLRPAPSPLAMRLEAAEKRLAALEAQSASFEGSVRAVLAKAQAENLRTVSDAIRRSNQVRL